MSINGRKRFLPFLDMEQNRYGRSPKQAFRCLDSEHFNLSWKCTIYSRLGLGTGVLPPLVGKLSQVGPTEFFWGYRTILTKKLGFGQTPPSPPGLGQIPNFGHFFKAPLTDTSLKHPFPLVRYQDSSTLNPGIRDPRSSKSKFLWKRILKSWRARKLYPRIQDS